MKFQKLLFSFLILSILSCLILTETEDEKIRKQYEQQTADTIIDTFINNGNRNELFNVWHNVYKRKYELNNEEANQRSAFFYSNVDKIAEHNKNQGAESTDKLSVNTHADKSDEELVKEFKIRSGKVTWEDFKTIFKRLPTIKTMFDHFEDEL